MKYHGTTPAFFKIIVQEQEEKKKMLKEKICVSKISEHF